MPDLVIRPAVQDDIEALWDFLAMAAYEPDAEAAKAVPPVAKYLVGWQRPGDFGFIAEQNGEIIGAAWARRFSAAELKVPYGDEEAPKAISQKEYPYSAEAGRIRISHLGNSGWRANRLSTACMAFLPRAMPF